MKTPLRLAILRKLQALIEQTEFNEETVPNGVMYDLNGKVYRGRALVGKEYSGGYYINIIDAPRQDPGITAGNKQAIKNTWELYIQTVIADDGRGEYDIQDDLYWLGAAVEIQLSKLVKEDVRHAKPVYPADYRFGESFYKRVVSVEVGPSLVRPPNPDANEEAFMFQSIVIELAGVIGDPFIDID